MASRKSKECLNPYSCASPRIRDYTVHTVFELSRGLEIQPPFWCLSTIKFSLTRLVQNSVLTPLWVYRKSSTDTWVQQHKAFLIFSIFSGSLIASWYYIRPIWYIILPLSPFAVEFLTFKAYVLNMNHLIFCRQFEVVITDKLDPDTIFNMIFILINIFVAVMK